jgi:hypothetical protein
MEQYCSTGQSPQRAVVPVEKKKKKKKKNIRYTVLFISIRRTRRDKVNGNYNLQHFRISV